MGFESLKFFKKPAAEAETKPAEKKEYRPVISRLIETKDGQTTTGFYLTMPDGERKLVMGEPRAEGGAGKAADEYLRNSLASPEEIKTILEHYGVKSIEELRAQKAKSAERPK